MTYGSSQRMCESNVHTWENPSASARLASSITRAAGGVVWRTMPMSMGRDINPGALQPVQTGCLRCADWCQAPLVGGSEHVSVPRCLAPLAVKGARHAQTRRALVLHRGEAGTYPRRACFIR